MYTGPNPVAETLTTFEDDGFYSQLWTFAEHSGTHVDVPGHFVEGNRLAHELTPDELMAPLAVIDISDRAAVDPDAAVTVADIRGYERRHGRIREEPWCASTRVGRSEWTTRTPIATPDPTGSSTSPVSAARRSSSSLGGGGSAGWGWTR